MGPHAWDIFVAVSTFFNGFHNSGWAAEGRLPLVSRLLEGGEWFYYGCGRVANVSNDIFRYILQGTSEKCVVFLCEITYFIEFNVPFRCISTENVADINGKCEAFTDVNMN